jgi:tRNA pseudouridine55 synthase
VTREQVEAALPKFRGDIMQTPPLYVIFSDLSAYIEIPPRFSALKMDGKPLYEYAREGIPIPRPIEARQVTIHSLEILKWLGTEHSFSWPEKQLSLDEKKAIEIALQGIQENASLTDRPESTSNSLPPTAFVLKMVVSGGTYVRSIVHDLAQAVGSAGHVVSLTRSRQGRFAIEPVEEGDHSCVSWETFQKANAEVDEDGWTEWEREVMERLEVV